MKEITTEQAFNNLVSFVNQALSKGLFQNLDQVAIAQQSLLKIKIEIEKNIVKAEVEKILPEGKK